jgi:hypothetical protein
LSGSQSRRRSFRVPNLSIKRVPSSSLRSSVSLKESQNSSTESCNEMVCCVMCNVISTFCSEWEYITCY